MSCLLLVNLQLYVFPTFVDVCLLCKFGLQCGGGETESINIANLLIKIIYIFLLLYVRIVVANADTQLSIMIPAANTIVRGHRKHPGCLFKATHDQSSLATYNLHKTDILSFSL